MLLSHQDFDIFLLDLGDWHQLSLILVKLVLAQIVSMEFQTIFCPMILDCQRPQQSQTWDGLLVVVEVAAQLDRLPLR